MAEVRLDRITVQYGNKTAIQDFSLHVRDGECLTLLGPSPCGKTTVLRAIAGLTKLAGGEVTIGNRVVASKDRRIFIPPEKRNVGVVFQDYAVWPHMTVEANVLYPLKKRKVPKREAKEQVDGCLRQVRMADYAARMPFQLSGGQQQRVALARALVASQDVVLLDEPLTNLDANLREEMRFEIKRLQNETGITVIYVTHDQDIALVISDQIAVMDKTGSIRQLGAPEELCRNPADSFVYRFLGLSNFIPVEVVDGRMWVRNDAENIPFPYPSPSGMGDKPFFAACRPMDIALSREAADGGAGATAGAGAGGALRGLITRVIYLGNIYEYRVQVGDTEIRVQQDSFEAFRNGIFHEGEVCALGIKDIRYYEEMEEVS
ncbi:MAG: ABC transporter ATP-binding protein [Firmicutes bacterium]|jgi:iron(III) transport system ATP-binding protein|nr:ABC transporter ATP-binding protein [Bacillota bacterium]